MQLKELKLWQELIEDQISKKLTETADLYYQLSNVLEKINLVHERSLMYSFQQKWHTFVKRVKHYFNFIRIRKIK